MAKKVIDEAREIALNLYRGQASLVDFREAFFTAPGDVAPAPFHYEWSDLLLNGKRNMAVMGFRESAKSAYVIRAHTLYRLVYPSQQYSYCVFIMANSTKAEQKLDEIAREYMEHPTLSGNLVEVVRKAGGVFHVKVKNTGGNVIDVRIEAYGKGASIRGLVWKDRRPGLVIIDDPQDKEDATSESVLEKDWNWFLSDVKFLGKHSRIFLIGNNLGEKCIIQRCVNSSDELGFDVATVPIMDEMEQPLWPDAWTSEEILQERADFAALGKLSIWYMERMCKAVAPETQRFNREDFRYYRPGEADTSRMAIYTTVDLAISKHSDADYTAICTVGVTHENHWFVLDLKYGRWNPSEILDEIFSTVSRWRPIVVGIEAEAYQAAMVHFLEKDMVHRNSFFIVQPLKTRGKRKELRIDMMQPRFKTNTVWFPRGAAFLPELEGELEAFTLQGTTGLHDDLIDALSYMEQLAQPPSGWAGEEFSDGRKPRPAGAM